MLRTVGALSGPLYLLLVALTYVLGASMAKYLGYPLRVGVLAQGLAVALLLQASMGWLAAAFRPLQERILDEESPAQRATIRKSVLNAAVGALAGSAAIAFALFAFEEASFGAALCLGMSVILLIVYAIPPMRGADRGFGELLTATLIAYLIPTLGFLLQADEIHWLLNLCAVALTFLLLATLLALELPSYAADVQHERTTMLTRMGWERAVWMHHALIGAAYVLLGFAVLQGVSFRLIGPAFLSLPFALLQAFLLQGIARGARPIWSLVRASALVVFALTAYLLALSFWLR